MATGLDTGLVAVVTGGARGIGLAVVEALADAGVGVACLDRHGADFTAFEETCRDRGVAHHAVGVDVADQADVHQAVRAAATLGAVGYAVNCAGIDQAASSASVDASAWQQVMGVNLNGLFYSCQAEYAVMAPTGGAIVNIASMSGSIINRSDPHVAYCASKAGVVHLSKGLGVEWAKDGVRVNSVSPGYTETAQTAHNPPELTASFREQTPMGRMATPAEIAAPVLFLLGPGASFITATDLLVDGGFTAW
jgi:NAD(P)-dependent dehydrogenase (short-subunit alcohol dehydrogenase family)